MIIFFDGVACFRFIISSDWLMTENVDLFFLTAFLVRNTNVPPIELLVPQITFFCGPHKNLPGGKPLGPCGLE